MPRRKKRIFKIPKPSKILRFFKKLVKTPGRGKEGW